MNQVISRKAANELQPGVPVLDAWGLQWTLHDGSKGLPVDASAPGEARRHVRAVLDQWGMNEALIEDAELVMSELVTNAVNASAKLDEPKIEIGLYTDHSWVDLVVFDQADGWPVAVVSDDTEDAHARALGEALTEGGRGLAMVAKFTEGNWGCKQILTGKLVHATLPVPR